MPVVERDTCTPQIIVNLVITRMRREYCSAISYDAIAVIAYKVVHTQRWDEVDAGETAPVLRASRFSSLRLSRTA